MASITITGATQREDYNIMDVVGTLDGVGGDQFVFSKVYYSTVGVGGPWAEADPHTSDPLYVWPAEITVAPGAAFVLPVELPEAADGTMYFKIEADYTASQITPGYIFISPFSYDTVVQGTWNYYAGVMNKDKGFLYNQTNADGDSITYKQYLAAGTYTLVVAYGDPGVNAGKVDIDVDGDTNNFDLFAGSNSRHTATITVATSGVKVITVTLNGTNPGSGGHRAYINNISLYRTS